MAKVIIFSRQFPQGHKRAGQETDFVEKFWNSACRYMNYYEICTLNEKQGNELLTSLWDFWKDRKKHGDCTALKNHTIRGGRRFKAGDYFSPRVWSGKPYNSKQIIIGPDTEIKKVWDVTIFSDASQTTIGLPSGEMSTWNLIPLHKVADNDGLLNDDFISWFNPKAKDIEFEGQIICWNESINY